MPLTPGTRLGPYEIVASLGAGGMGEVYRATDTKLGREVAIKVLPDSFARDAERLARFDREARVLASLNHPNIAVIHGIEDSGGKTALVMELVQGEDLSERIARGPIPLEETLPIAVQIARALEGAHQKGVIHRDLKPANVRLTTDGQVKVLDFGLAKAPDVESSSDSNLSHSPTLTQQATQLGIILGTAAYMSPEQARGKVVDARSDIFSFGCLLFEMLSGARAFAGEDVSEILASVIKRDVQWDRLPRSMPERVRRLIARCLQSREERYQAIGDVRIDLAEILVDPAALDAGSAVPARGGLSRRTVALLAIVAVVSALAGVFATRALRPASPSPSLPLLKFRLDVSSDRDLALSPDGRWIACLSEGGVWVRRLGQLQSRTLDLPWKVGGYGVPAWSFDSRALVLTDETRGDLWRVSVDGGDPQLVARIPKSGFLWGIEARSDDEILFGMANAGLYRAPIRGGEPQLLLPAGEDELLTAPCVLPNGRDVLFGESKRGRIEAFDGSRRKVVLEIEGRRIFSPKYSPSGHLLFSGEGSDQGIWAVPFSAERLETTGAPFRILPRGRFSVSRGGTLAFQQSTGAGSPTRLVWTDRSGTVLGEIGEPLKGMRQVALSPDGRHAAVSAVGEEGPDGDSPPDVFIVDLSTGARYPIRDDVGGDLYPHWRSGGSTVGFVTYAGGIRDVQERAVGGTGKPTRIARALWARASRDGRYLLLGWLHAGTDFEPGLRYLEEGSSELHPLVDGETWWADLSPDNRYVAYTLRSEPGLFLKRFLNGAGLVPVTSEEASAPLWSRDGQELFFWRGDTLMAVSIDSRSDDPRPGPARALFSAASNRLVSGYNYDVAVDGRFLMLQLIEDPKETTAEPGIVIIQNWAAEFAPEADSR